jgi:hypothetical protein
MALPSYPAARSVAVTVQEHFARNLAGARTRGREDLAPEPDESVIEAMIDAGFWASLRREEGLAPKISLAYMPPEAAEQPLLFTHPLSLAPAVLAKVAPAVERPGIHLGVWMGPNGLQVWGTTRRLPPYCFVLEVVASGLLVVKHRSEPFGKFVNVAVLEGDQVKVIDERNAFLPECPGLVQSLLGFDLMATDAASPNVLVQLAASMRAHGRGGALLVVPAGSESWRDSIVSPITYAVGPPFSGLADLLRQDAVETTSHEWQEELRRAVDALAGLTAVDGATVIDNRYSLLAFGAKITRKRGSVTVERVVVTEPIVDSPRTTAMPTQFGGTRHLSAAQFVHDQRDAFALVASQDGRFTIFKWSPNEDMVHAHRVEALLL